MLHGGEDKKKGKVKKGWLAVRVGAEEGGDERGFQRFVIPIAYLYHPLFRRLLEAARDAYGYDYSGGPLRLPCAVDEFLRLRALVERETTQSAATSSSSSSSHHRVHAGGGGSHGHHYSLSPCTRAAPRSPHDRSLGHRSRSRSRPACQVGLVDLSAFLRARRRPRGRSSL